jgi:hypothetical protein
VPYYRPWQYVLNKIVVDHSIILGLLLVSDVAVLSVMCSTGRVKKNLTVVEQKVLGNRLNYFLK